MDMVCIVCPRGCRMKIEGGVVSGNFCKKGESFAIAESTCPMRTVCTTVKTDFPSMPVLPVRTAGEIPKDKIGELMKLANSVIIKKKIKCGDVVLSNVVGTDVDLIATASSYSD